MKKLILLTVTGLLFIPFLTWGAFLGDGYAKYDNSAKTCETLGPVGDEFGQVKLGWQKEKGNLIYVASCSNWEDEACCEKICAEYSPESGNCNPQEDILSSLKDFKKSSEDKFSYAVYIFIILFVILVTYFIIGILSVIYFIIRG